MKKYLHTITLLLVIVICTNLNAIKKEKHKASAFNINKWEVIDIAFKSGESQTPFETEFSAIFTAPDGSKQNIPGFYNGNNTYVIRFSGKQSGLYTYKTTSSHAKLNNKKGKLLISEQAHKNHHGGIITHPDKPQHFFYEDGTPYFLMGFEMDWLFALDYGKPKLDTAQVFIKRVAQNGFNHLVTNLFAYDIKWERDAKIKPEHDFGSPDFFPFAGNNTNPDFSTLNIDFFNHFDKVVELLDDNEIVAHLMIYVWNKKVNWPAMNTPEDDRFFDYVIKRYQAFPNVVWDISKEALAYGRCTPEYVSERIERARNLDAFKRLLTVHSYRFCKDNPDLVDFMATQNWQTELYQFTQRETQKHPNKPMFNIEHGGYERGPYHVFAGNYDSPESCLHRNYICAFGGAYSTYYWQGCSWSIIVTNTDALPAHEQPMMHYYKHFTQLFQKYPFHTFTPTNKAQSGFCLTNNNGTYLYLCPSANSSLTIKLPKTDKKITTQWFNPLTGEYTAPVQIKWESYRWCYVPKTGQDWILIAEVEQ
ncbi:apiosidase-like domain-containing protein [Saccharicrinis aurantiacus]|uniref:apiosidase-like domain-containing protein n=1 Tax=Saccharicrinis aurantiacus TaxID=1849719 RepID=UPI0008386AB8|nr:DUF4038 domain-containing protein [Saccharicrinis aurantiacus]